MRLFASWWDRVPVRVAALALIAALAVLPHLPAAIQSIGRGAGFIWG